MGAKTWIQGVARNLLGIADEPKQSASPTNGHGSLPVGIDRFSNLPLHYEPPECPICPKEDDGVCYDCNGTLKDPEAPFGYGVESITVTHVHIRTIPDTGKQIRVPVHRKLCIPCFRVDWAKANPEKPCDL